VRRRIATVEPVFANTRHHKGMSRFTLRATAKVSTQWQLVCLVHNIEKMARPGVKTRQTGPHNAAAGPQEDQLDGSGRPR